MLVIDTHVLIWWLADSPRLSSFAKRLIDETLKNDREVLLSAVSAWEIAMLVKQQRLGLSMDIDSWLEQVELIDGIRFVPIDTDIGQKATNLPGDFHQDFADSIIVATARRLGAPLVTSDERILDYPHVKGLW